MAVKNGRAVLCYVGLGSNLGDRAANIAAALEALKSVPGVRVLRVAPLYRTAPLDYLDQDEFLNTVVELETSLGAHELLARLLAIEDAMGRVRTVPKGPRVIDLDLLIYGDFSIDEPGLVVPHPRMCQRAFVVVPLADLNPDLVLPGGSRAAELAEKLALEQEIQRFDGRC